MSPSIGESSRRLSMSEPATVLAIVGPKGGVGKTIICANLAIAISKMHKRVIAVDLDLGAANLHAIFGVRDSGPTLDDFIFNKVKHLSDVVMSSGMERLGIIPGGDIPGIANLTYQKKMKLIRQLCSLETDVIIVDLGAGSSNNVIDFLSIARKGLLVSTAEVPSLLNTYSFIKTAVFRRLSFHFRGKGYAELLDLLERAKDPSSNPHLKTMESFLGEVSKVSPSEAESARQILSNFRPIIIVNRVEKASEKSAGEAIQNLMQKYLNLDCSSIMTVREDPGLRRAIARMKPIMVENPASPFSIDVIEIAHRVLH